MDEYWTGILGGLIGSISTVLVSQILNMIQKSKEHKYGLEKTFFEKKLLAAEAAITQYTILSVAMSNLSVLYERIDDDENDVEANLKETLHQQVTQQLEIANNSSFIVANSITLYFDFSVEFNQNQIIREFYNRIGSIRTFMDSRDLSYDNFENLKGTNMENEAYQLYLVAQTKVDESIQGVSEIYVKFNSALFSMIGQIRNEMKKFDY